MQARPRRPRVAPGSPDTAVLPWRIPRACAGVSTHAAPDPVACAGAMPAGTQNPTAPRPARQSVLQILPAPDGCEPAGGTRGAIRIRIRPSPCRNQTDPHAGSSTRIACGRLPDAGGAPSRFAGRLRARIGDLSSQAQRGSVGSVTARGEIVQKSLRTCGFGELGATRNQSRITNPPAVRP